MEAITYTVFVNGVRSNWLYVPTLAMTLHDDWEVVRNEEMDIPTRTYQVDHQKLGNPDYVRHMLSEMKVIEEEKKITNDSIKRIMIRTELVDIMKELVKIYDEKVRLAFLEARVSKKVEKIYPIEERSVEDALQYFKLRDQ